MKQSDTTRLSPEFLSARNLGVLLDLSARSIWKKSRDGSIPPPIYVGHGTPRWIKADVLNALRYSRKFGRRKMPASRKPKGAPEPITSNDAMRGLAGGK